MNRRGFLATSAGALAASYVPLSAQTGPPKRIAAIMTIYRPGSHSDVIVGKYLEGWNQDSTGSGPRSKIVSMYTEQVPRRRHEPPHGGQVRRTDFSHDP